VKEAAENIKSEAVTNKAMMHNKMIVDAIKSSIYINKSTKLSKYKQKFLKVDIDVFCQLLWKSHKN
jgi:hypothetical protein